MMVQLTIEEFQGLRQARSICGRDLVVHFSNGVEHPELIYLDQTFANDWAREILEKVKTA